jgi:hypothetical protein
MRSIIVIVSLFIASASFAQSDCYPLNEKLQADTSRKSVKAYAATAWGKDSVVINWYAPAVRNRTIWGGLVPYTEVWVTGAHFATNIEFREKVVVNGVKLDKGRYALFTIPRQNDWIVIINKNWQQHLTDEYDPKDDVVRVTVQPQTACPLTERLQWGFSATDGKTGMLYMRWEKLQVAVPVSR